MMVPRRRQRLAFWAGAFAAFLLAHGMTLSLVGRVEPPFLCAPARLVLTPLGVCLRASPEDVPWESWAAVAAGLLLTWPLLLARSFPVAVIGAAVFWAIYVAANGVFSAYLRFYWGVRASVDLQMASWVVVLLVWGLRGLSPVESWRTGAALGCAAYAGLILLVGFTHTGPGAGLFYHARGPWVSGGGTACAALLAAWGIGRCVIGVAERRRWRHQEVESRRDSDDGAV